ncbi:MAG TPA: TetR/AcrR family transcriptional regulator [Mycobacterium sp.]|nr:TetR/AcrR family transcriptional regulator [Mycobacterium sp.]
MPSPARQRNARGCGNLLREEILSAATELLDAATLESEVTLRRIACAVGITAPAIYAHFEDRETILAEIVERSWQQVVADIRLQAATGRTPRERLHHGCRTYVAFAERFPMRYALMTQASTQAPAAATALEVVTQALANCRTAPGLLAPRDAARVAATLSTALHGVAMLNRTGVPSMWLTGISADEVIATLVDAAIDQQNRTEPQETP